MSHKNSLQFYTALITFCALFVIKSNAILAQQPAILPPFAKAILGSDRFGDWQEEGIWGPNRSLLTSASNGYVRMWDLTSQHLSWEHRPSLTKRFAAFAGPDSVVLSTPDGQISILAASSGAELRHFAIQPCSKDCKIIKIDATDRLLLTYARSNGDPPQSAIRLWSLADGMLLKSHHIEGHIGAMSLSADSASVAWIVETGDDKAPRVERALITDLEHPQTLPCPLTSHSSVVSRDLLWFTPDSQTLAIVGDGSVADDYVISVCLWSVDQPTSTARVASLPYLYKKNRLNAAAFSLDSGWLMVGLSGKELTKVFEAQPVEVRLVEVSSGRVVNPSDFQDDALPAVAALSPNIEDLGGWTLQTPPFDLFFEHWEPLRLSASFEFVLYHDIPTRELLHHVHRFPLYYLATNDDGSILISRDFTDKSLLWKTPTNVLGVFETHGQATFSANGRLFEACPAVQPDGESDYSREGDFGWWDTATLTKISIKRGPDWMLKTFSWLDDGSMLVCREHKTVYLMTDIAEQSPDEAMPYIITAGFEIWNEKGEIISRLPTKFSYCPPLQAVSVASMRAVIVHKIYDGVRSRFVRRDEVINLETGKILMKVPENAEQWTLSLDGRFLAFFTRRVEKPPSPSQLWIYDVETGAVLVNIAIKSPDFFLHASNPLIFSADNAYLIAVDKENIRVIDLQTQAIVQTLAGHTQDVSALALSGDNTTLFSGQHDGIIYAWDWAGIRAAQK